MCEGVQYGIISSGYGCSYNGYPGIYIKVFYFEDYIKKIIQKGNSFEFRFLIEIHTTRTVKFDPTLYRRGSGPQA